jgi:hypothetical protein
MKLHPRSKMELIERAPDELHPRSKMELGRAKMEPDSVDHTLPELFEHDYSETTRELLPTKQVGWPAARHQAATCG